MMKALVYDNKVVDLADVGFEVHRSLTWMDAPEGCEYGWELVSGTLQAPAGPTEEEVEAGVRSMRDSMLAATDWWASTDLTMTAEQLAYRQALRDITTHANWPNLADADWPVAPE